MQQLSSSYTAWSLLLSIFILSQAYCSMMSCDQFNLKGVDSETINVEVECLHNGNVTISWNWSPIHVDYCQIEYLCYSDQIEQNTGTYEIVACDANDLQTLNFLTNESQCIVTGCYIGSVDMWILPITCNIGDAVTNETTLNSTQVFSELPPITRMDTMVSAITSLPIVYPSPSNRKSNIYTEDTSLTTVHPNPSNGKTNTEDMSPTIETILPVMMYVIGVIVLILMIVMAVSFSILCFWIRKRNKKVIKKLNKRNDIVNISPGPVINISESSSVASFMTYTVDLVVPATEAQGVLKDIVIDTASFNMTHDDPICKKTSHSRSLHSLSGNSINETEQTPKSPDRHTVSLILEVTNATSKNIQHDSDEGSWEESKQSDDRRISFPYTSDHIVSSHISDNYIPNSPITMAFHGIIPTMDSYDSNGYILSHPLVYEFQDTSY